MTLFSYMITIKEKIVINTLQCRVIYCMLTSKSKEEGDSGSWNLISNY